MFLDEMDAYDRKHSLDRTQAGRTVASQPRKPKRSTAVQLSKRSVSLGCTEAVERLERGPLHVRGPGYGGAWPTQRYA